MLISDSKWELCLATYESAETLLSSSHGCVAISIGASDMASLRLNNTNFLVVCSVFITT